MLARAALTPSVQEWNARWDAPWGTAAAAGVGFKERLGAAEPAGYGPFAFQNNNTTREFEWGWAWNATPLQPGMNVVEVGGGLSGFQYALAQAGMRVTKVDTGEEDGAGRPENPLTPANHARLNAVFGTDVALRQQPLADIALEADSVDRVFCISTLEHFSTTALEALLPEVRRVLRPGGSLVLTVDLMLDLEPFTDVQGNEWGRNIDLHWVVERSGLKLGQGNPGELCGFPAFSPRHVEAILEELVIGRGHPTLVQALVLEKAPFL